MESVPRYVIFNNAYPGSIIVIQSFDINHVLWAIFDIFLFERRCIPISLSSPKRSQLVGIHATCLNMQLHILT